MSLPKITGEPYCREVLANWIYGPSAISLHYALGFYGLIPERVHAVTSINFNKSKKFSTPAGLFIYRYINVKCYQIGLTIREYAPRQRFFIATPEKAVADLLTLCAPKLESAEELNEYLEEDMRMDIDELKKFKIEDMMLIQEKYKNSNLEKFIQWRIAEL